MSSEEDIRERISNKSTLASKNGVLYYKFTTYDLTDLEVVREQLRIRRYFRYHDLRRLKEIYGNNHPRIKMWLDTDVEINEEIDYLRTLKASLIRESTIRSVLTKIKPAIRHEEDDIE
jgi:hypothetical protein